MRVDAVRLSGSGVLVVLALAAVGVVGWRAYRAAQALGKTASEAAAAAAASINQGIAEVSSYVGNALGGPPPAGDPLRKLLYSDAGYTGNDSAGVPVMASPWFSRDDLRRYEYETRDAATAAGRPAPVVGNNGAAFGIYPRA